MRPGLRSSSLSVLVVCLSLCAPVFGGDGAAERIARYVSPFVAAGHLSGSLMVAEGENVLFDGSFGRANYELGVEVDSSTRFCVASITKPMTQIIAVRLVEAGVLTGGDPVSKWIPDFPNGDAITLEMLLRHRAGIPHRVTSAEQEAMPLSAADMVELVKLSEPLFEPGTGESYSSAGYSVVARILELATSKSYAELLDQHVFGPAGMSDSVQPSGSDLIPRRAGSYAFSGSGALVNSPLKNYSFLVGAGSVFTTPGDLIRLMRAVVSGAYGEAVKATLMREGGLRWNGRTDGYRAFADYHAESGLYLAFVSNILSGAGDMVRRDVPKLALGEEVETPEIPEHRAVVIGRDLLRSYEGGYELRPGTVLTLSVEGDDVSISGWLLIPTSETTFFSPQDYGQITVVKGEGGAVERLDWTVAGETHPMPRVPDSGD